MTQDYAVHIEKGVQVIYHDDGTPTVGQVTSIEKDAGLMEVRGVPGVLRIEDILAVGVYTDEARFKLTGSQYQPPRILPAEEACRSFDGGLDE